MIVAHAFKITRDAELDVDDDISKSYLEKMKESVEMRKAGETVRFVFDAAMPIDQLQYLMEALGLKAGENIIPGGTYHNFRDFMSFPNFGNKSFQFKKQKPIAHPELAQRVITELKDKAPKIMAMGGEGSAVVEADESMVIDVQTPVDTPVKNQNRKSEASAQADALSALINLGYAHGDAAGAIAQVTSEIPSSISTEIIKAALKLLAPKGR